MKADLIIHSARQLLTIAAPAGPKRGAAMNDLGLVADGALAIDDERIVGVGTTREVLGQFQARQKLDASGHVVMPGFVDPHTHVIFAGDRADEFERRVRGATYREIMAAGGGIMSTVRATRAASLDQLVAETRPRLDAMLAHGTTTAEVKTGYGLDTANEFKMLVAIAALDAQHPIDLIPTFLGAHAVPTEYAGRADEYVAQVIQMLPQLADAGNFAMGVVGRRVESSRRRLAEFADVFCDEGAFTVEQARKILLAAKQLGLGLRIHADEFANLGAATLAAELGAASADHLVVTRRDEMRAMARAGVVAVLLPGTTFGLGQTNFADGRAFVEENVPVVLGSDINPGTAWCESMPFILALAARYLKMTPAEAIAAATLNAAHSLGRGSYLGSLEVGKQADVLLLDVPDYRHLAYRFGSNPVKVVFKKGKRVVG